MLISVPLGVPDDTSARLGFWFSRSRESLLYWLIFVFFLGSIVGELVAGSSPGFFSVCSFLIETRIYLH